MEEAPGTELSKYDPESFLDVLRAAGKGLGYFHYFMALDPDAPFLEWETLAHGDLHWGNIFFDTTKEQTTFIDNGSITIRRGWEQGVYFDIYNLSYKQFYVAVSHDWVSIKQVLSGIAYKEALRIGLRTDSYEDYFADGLISAFKQPNVLSDFQKSDLYSEMRVSSKEERLLASLGQKYMLKALKYSES